MGKTTTMTTTIAGICCASALLVSAFMTGCADDKQSDEVAKETTNNSTIVTNTNNSDNANDANENTEVATEVVEIASANAGGAVEGAPADERVPAAGEQVTFTYHPSEFAGFDAATWDPDFMGGYNDQYHKTIYCTSNGDGTFSFTTNGGAHLTASFNDTYIPAYDEYDVNIVDDAGNRVIMVTNGGEWLLLDGNENTNPTFL